jgi:hypothetical protein
MEQYSDAVATALATVPLKAIVNIYKKGYVLRDEQKGGKVKTNLTHVNTGRVRTCKDGVRRSIYLRVKDNVECVKVKNAHTGKMMFMLASKLKSP